MVSTGIVVAMGSMLMSRVVLYTDTRTHVELAFQQLDLGGYVTSCLQALFAKKNIFPFCINTHTSTKLLHSNTHFLNSSTFCLRCQSGQSLSCSQVLGKPLSICQNVKTGLDIKYLLNVNDDTVLGYVCTEICG